MISREGDKTKTMKIDTVQKSEERFQLIDIMTLNDNKNT